MPLPWLRLIDGVLGATDLVRFVKGRAGVGAPDATPPHALEARLAGVVVAALKEAFDRDHERLEIERQRMDEERARVERAMRLELMRQAGDREIGRLRLLSGVAVASLIGSMFLVTRIVGGELLARTSFGIGWLLLLAAVAAAFAAQARVAKMLGHPDETSTLTDITSTSGGAAAPWLIVFGLASIALGVLLV
jgi:hypothetical protein